MGGGKWFTWEWGLVGGSWKVGFGGGGGGKAVGRGGEIGVGGMMGYCGFGRGWRRSKGVVGVQW